MLKFKRTFSFADSPTKEASVTDVFKMANNIPLIKVDTCEENNTDEVIMAYKLIKQTNEAAELLKLLLCEKISKEIEDSHMDTFAELQRQSAYSSLWVNPLVAVTICEDDKRTEDEMMDLLLQMLEKADMQLKDSLATIKKQYIHEFSPAHSPRKLYAVNKETRRSRVIRKNERRSHSFSFKKRNILPSKKPHQKNHTDELLEKLCHRTLNLGI